MVFRWKPYSPQWLHEPTNNCFLGFEWPDAVVQKPLHSAQVTIWCAVSGYGILGPYFVEDDTQNPLTVNQECYREIIIAPFVKDLKHFVAPETCHYNSGCSKMELQPTWQGSHLPVCNNTLFLPHQKPETTTTVDAARWSYSPHGRGVTCLSAITLWWSFNFPWNGIPVPFTLPRSHSPRCLHMGHAERIRFPIRRPTWKCSQIMGQDSHLFDLATTCIHQHVQQSKGPLWTMCETWMYTFWTMLYRRI